MFSARRCDTFHALEIFSPMCDMRASCLPVKGESLGICSCADSFLLVADSEDHQSCVVVGSSLALAGAFFLLSFISGIMFFWISRLMFLGYRRNTLGWDSLAFAVWMIALSDGCSFVSKTIFSMIILGSEEQAPARITMFLALDGLLFFSCNAAVLSFGLTVIRSLVRAIKIFSKKPFPFERFLTPVTILFGVISAAGYLLVALMFRQVVVGVCFGSLIILTSWVIFRTIANHLKQLLLQFTSESKVSRSALMVLTQTINRVIFSMLAHVLSSMSFVGVFAVARTERRTALASTGVSILMLLLLTCYVITLGFLTWGIGGLLDLRHRNAMGIDERDASSQAMFNKSEPHMCHNLHLFVIRQDSANDLFEEINNRLSMTQGEIVSTDRSLSYC
eukprot:c1058_g1_i1.p1 GENE.c1058_g1_i1~~c1058_g1_i1.p1  ORF type:complete len:392 (-),score=35.73 c1058_g1_i1:40-1215(-)